MTENQTKILTAILSIIVVVVIISVIVRGGKKEGGEVIPNVETPQIATPTERTMDPCVNNPGLEGCGKGA